MRSMEQGHAWKTWNFCDMPEPVVTLFIRRVIMNYVHNNKEIVACMEYESLMVGCSMDKNVFMISSTSDRIKIEAVSHFCHECRVRELFESHHRSVNQRNCNTLYFQVMEVAKQLLQLKTFLNLCTLLWTA